MKQWDEIKTGNEKFLLCDELMLESSSSLRVCASSTKRGANEKAKKRVALREMTGSVCLT
jgi:hypothetical protein